MSTPGCRENYIAPAIAFIVWTMNTKNKGVRSLTALGSQGSRNQGSLGPLSCGLTTRRFVERRLCSTVRGIALPINIKIGPNLNTGVCATATRIRDRTRCTTYACCPTMLCVSESCFSTIMRVVSVCDKKNDTHVAQRCDVSESCFPIIMRVTKYTSNV